MTWSEDTQPILSDIHRLQAEEKALYSKYQTHLSELETCQNNNDCTVQEDYVNLISGDIAAINQISEARENLYNALIRTYGNIQEHVGGKRSELVNQMTIVGVVEEELNNTKANFKSLKGAKNNKMRMVEINTYYSKRYDAHTGVMKMIIMICVPLLALAILDKKEFIPHNLSRILALIIIVVGGYFLLTRINDLWWRDNMNYDEYDWDFDPDGHHPTVYEYDKQALQNTEIGNKWDELTGDLDSDCLGSECCGKNTIWSKKDGHCKLPAKSGNDTDGKGLGKAIEQFETFQGGGRWPMAAGQGPEGCSSLVLPFSNII